MKSIKFMALVLLVAGSQINAGKANSTSSNVYPGKQYLMADVASNSAKNANFGWKRCEAHEAAMTHPTTSANDKGRITLAQQQGKKGKNF